MVKTTWQKGIPLESALQERLRALMRERGEDKVAELFGLGETSIVRAAAGLGLRRGTLLVIEMKIGSLEKAA